MLYLLNTTVIPHGADGLWIMRTVTAEWAREAAAAAASVGQLLSAVGHSSSAEAMAAALGMPVPCNRITVVPEPGDELLCLRLHSRPPEGVVLTLEELEATGYSWALLSYQG